jgi:RNA polymerase sigma-70 factor (ECF subfamily)
MIAQSHRLSDQSASLATTADRFSTDNGEPDPESVHELKTSRFVERLKVRDVPAFELLVEKCTPRLLSVAKRFLHNPDDAADAVQDAFLLAYISMDRFRGGSSVYTWLYRILVNTCLMKLRSRQSDRSISFQALVARDPAGDESPGVEFPAKVTRCQMESDEMKAFIRDCIDDLPHDFRTIILLRDIEQLDTVETSRLLKISTGAVKTRLHRARMALRALLENAFEGILDPRIGLRNPSVSAASN